jgi:hypothetical protein
VGRPVPKLICMSSRDMHVSSVPVIFLLLAQYGGRPTVPLETVVADYFSHLTAEKFCRKALRGEIDIPIIRIERSQKSQKHIALRDLADYLDKRWNEAIKERDALCGQK